VRLAIQVAHRLGAVARRHIWHASEQFDVPLDGRQRRPELVGGVCDEALLRAVRVLQAGQHLIEGVGEFAELISARRLRNTPREAAGGRDRARRPCHGRHGAQRRPRDQQASGPGRGHAA
jgi:hypothetical protein